MQHEGNKELKINHTERNHNPRVWGSSPSYATVKINELAERKAKLQIAWLPHGYHKNRFRRLSLATNLLQITARLHGADRARQSNAA